MAELTMYFGPVVYDFTMEVLLLNGEYDAVLEKTNDLIQQFEAGGMRLFTPDLWHKRGQALRALGRGAEALQATLEARRLAMAQVSRRSLWAILSDLVLMAPEAESAEAYRKEGEEVVGYISNHIHDPQLRAAFLNLPAVRRLTGSLIS